MSVVVVILRYLELSKLFDNANFNKAIKELVSMMYYYFNLIFIFRYFVNCGKKLLCFYTRVTKILVTRCAIFNLINARFIYFRFIREDGNQWTFSAVKDHSGK